MTQILPKDKPDLQQYDELYFQHGALTATTTVKITAAKRPFVVDYVEYHNITGLAADATNAFAGKIRNTTDGVDVATIFDTDADDGAALTADALVNGVLSVVAGALYFDVGDVVAFVATEDGAATLPAGEGRLGIRYL